VEDFFFFFFKDILTDEGTEKEVIVLGTSGYRIMFHLAIDLVVYISSHGRTRFTGALITLLKSIKSAEK
jgi:hypothetical protein